MLRPNQGHWRALFPKAPQAVIDAFARDTEALARSGMLDQADTLAFAVANINHECAGFALPGLTENLNYSAARMAAVWPNRFHSAAAVRAKYGSAKGWQKKAFDDIYGDRMGNRPGTSDGSTFIGRGGPQVTGRDGYEAVGRIAGLPLVDQPELACDLDKQALICAAFVEWKSLSAIAKRGDFYAYVRVWNGGSNGIAERERYLAMARRVAAGIPSGDDEVKTTREVQQRLRDLGYYEVGLVDGKPGAKTKAALIIFQSEHGLPETGEADAATDAVLFDTRTEPRQVSDERASVTLADVKQASPVARAATTGKIASLVQGIGGAVAAAGYGVTQFFGDAASRLAPLREYLRDVPPWVWALAAVAIAYVIWRSSHAVQKAKLDEIRSGKDAG